MKRLPLLLSLTVVLTALTVPAASAAPDPEHGGPAELVTFVGDGASATGNAMSNGRCDVNADDHDDVVVGAWFWDKAPTNNIGAAYVLLGGTSVRGGSLADPAAAGAVRIDGPTDDPRSVGFSVGCLGDVNGDGFDDIGIGDYQHNQAYVVFGAAQFSALSLDSLGDRGFVVKQGYDPASTPTRENLSFSMSAVGDIDGDGNADFALAAVVADTQGRTNNGRVWIIAGRDDIADVDVDSPAAGDVLLTVDGAFSEDRLGQAASAGDVNGDGIDDVVLGSYVSTPWGTGVAAPGAAYVVFGGTTGEVDAADLGTKGFSIFGPKRQRDRLGISVSGAGDVNGDGLADLLIGADGVSNNGRNGGAAVVLGSASTSTVYTDPVATHGASVFTCPADETAGECATPGPRGYWINGAVLNDSAGYSVAGVGDVNGDQVPDLAIGAYGYDPVNPAAPSTTMSGAGAVYVVFGQRDGTGTQQLAGLPEAQGYRVDGTKAGDRFGRQVGLVGDFDGNGVRDVVGAADFANRGVAQNGEVVVMLMGELDVRTAIAGPSSVRPGESATFTSTVTKSTGSQTPLAEGTVTFSLGGTVVPGCAGVTVVAGAASCTASFATETSGDVVAAFSGSPRLKGAASSALRFAVAKTPTTTSVEASATDAEPGQLVQLRAEVLDDLGAAVDSGSVRFDSDGQPVPGCLAVAVSSGSAVCTTAWSDRSSHEVTATYAGTQVVAGSASGSLTVAVGSDAIIKPSGSPAFVYGTATGPLTGEIRGTGRVPTGSVELREGGTVLATSSLGLGEYALTVGATALAPGAHTLTIAYAGDGRTRPSTRNVAVVVSRASSSVSFSRSRGTLKRSQRLTVSIRVRARGVVPTGAVQVRVGSKVVKTLTLKGGNARYTMPRFGSKGTKRVTIVYLGSDTVAPHASVSKKVKQK